MRSVLLSLIVLMTLHLLAQTHADSDWEMEDSHTTAGLRGIHNAGAGVAWASGTDGTVLRTEDGGYLWQSCSVPPGAAKLDFRGVWAWDAQTAIVMSSGLGDLSRLYKTTDGCATWTLLYTNPDPKGFWDAIAFIDKNTGFLLGDPVDGRFVLFSTTNGGATWRPDPGKGLAALPEEGAFAASNSSLQINRGVNSPGILVRFGTGGPKTGRMHSLSGNLTGAASTHTGLWKAASLPLASGNASSGVFSLAFRDQNSGVAVGGDYQKPGEITGTAAWTADGGGQWQTASQPPHGYRSAVARDATEKAWITAGTNGSDVSYDDGKTWKTLDDGNWNALSLPWVVGPKGRIAKLISLKMR